MGKNRAGVVVLAAMIMMVTGCSFESLATDERPGVENTVAPLGDAEEWSSYTSPDGAFSADFPQRPNQDQIEEPNTFGTLEVAISDVGSTAFLASHAELPEGMTFDLAGAIDGGFNSSLSNPVMKTTTDLTVDGTRCRQARGSGIAEGTETNMELLVCANMTHFFQLIVASDADSYPDAGRFFDSFTING